MALEFERISWIAALHSERLYDPAIARAIGDDCAILDPSRLRTGERLVWTIDASVEDVHFRRAWLSMEAIGARATIAAVSDVLAMGARPLALLAAWTVPSDVDDTAFEACARGQRDACDALGIALIGGNLSSGARLSLTTTALGATSRAVERTGARVGDLVVAVGAFGEAAIGLRALLVERAPSFGRFVERWRAPACHATIAPVLASRAHAMIDVSDGLAQDLGHIARASRVRIVVDEAALIARRAGDVVAACVALGVDPLGVELAGGEEYALVATIPRSAYDARFALEFPAIGEVVAGAGVVVRRPDGALVEPPAGYVHGADE